MVGIMPAASHTSETMRPVIAIGAEFTGYRRVGAGLLCRGLPSSAPSSDAALFGAFD